MTGETGNGIRVDGGEIVGRQKYTLKRSQLLLLHRSET